MLLNQAYMRKTKSTRERRWSEPASLGLSCPTYSTLKKLNWAWTSEMYIQGGHYTSLLIEACFRYWNTRHSQWCRSLVVVGPWWQVVCQGSHLGSTGQLTEGCSSWRWMTRWGCLRLELRLLGLSWEVFGCVCGVVLVPCLCTFWVPATC